MTARLPRPPAGLAAAPSGLVLALWVAICAAAPEFIWRGLRIAVGHVGLTDLYAALLVGAILAFFIEPAMERLRALLHGGHPAAPRGPLFTATVGIVFALAAVCLHDAMLAYLGGSHGGHAAAGGGLRAAIALTVSWAAVPFATALAWLAAGRRWLAIPLGLAAAASVFVVAHFFGWSRQDVLTTAPPCLAILGLGYRQAGSGGGLRRCAAVLAVVAAAWLAGCWMADWVFAVRGLRFRFYDAAAFWTDARFYAGWLAGLLLAPAQAGRAR